MNPSTLRQLWSLVDATQAATLMALDDAKLVEQLIEQLKRQCSLNSSQTDMVSAYIRSRIPLVRDLAQTRQLGYA